MVAPHLFIFGLGYSSQAIARAAIRLGFSVSGTRRLPAPIDNIDVYPFDAVPDAVLAGASHILTSVPPQEGEGDVVLARYGAKLFAPWLGYLSTTGVYGDWGGAWVDEQSELRPNNARLERRVAAEAAWRARGGHVFRLAGIYGPTRSAIDDVREGSARRIDKPGQVFSRIHVEDIAQVVVASMQKSNPGSTYNVCDDLPAPQAEVVAYACELTGHPVPPLLPFEQAALSPMGREFYSANRRVSNEKIKSELGVNLRYPTYREGLAALACD